MPDRAARACRNHGHDARTGAFGQQPELGQTFIRVTLVEIELHQHGAFAAGRTVKHCLAKSHNARADARIDDRESNHASPLASAWKSTARTGTMVEIACL